MIKHILIFGYNEYVKEIASSFINDGLDVHIYVITQGRYNDAKEDGFNVELFELDDDWISISKDFNIKELTCFCALNDDAKNVFLTISLRSEYKDMHIIAISTTKDSAEKLLLAGANKSFSKMEITGNVIVESLEKPAVIEVISRILSKDTDLKLAEYIISEKSILNGQYLHNINIHKKYNIIILAITNSKLGSAFIYASHGANHKMDTLDILVTLGKEENLINFEKAIK